MWFISRNYSLAVWDEYIPCQSWSGYRKISETLTYKIDILGIYKTSSYGLKPIRWSARLHYNGLSFPVSSKHPSCKSIKDACKQADKSLTDEIFNEACHLFSSQKLACCIVDKNSQPFFTSFGHPRWVDNHSIQNYPSGRYYYACKFKDEMQFFEANVSTYGYSSGNTDVKFQYWI